MSISNLFSIICGEFIHTLRKPIVTSLSAHSGLAAGGYSITIYGSHLEHATNVYFGSTPATIVSTGLAKIKVTVPSTSSPAMVHVTVVNAAGTSDTSLADEFIYQPIPIVASISPNLGPTTGGTSVAITGSLFTNGSTVNFGSTPATSVVVNSSTSIVAIAPAGLVGTVDITVTTGSGTSTTSTADQYTYEAAPVISAITPTSGPLSGGTIVTVTGNNFISGAVVQFGGTTASSVTVHSPTWISVTAPASAASTQDITVTTSIGTSPTSSVDQFTYLPIPTVTSVNPSAGGTSGGASVIINGTNFVNGAIVKFGGTVSVGVVVNSPTMITATAPARTAGICDITVTTPGGTSSVGTADQFTYVSLPVISSVSPSTGSSGGGTTVNIIGSNFITGATVKFGTVAGTGVIVNSSTSITVIAPAGSVGTDDVTVTTVAGTSAVNSNDKFTYTNAPTVTNISPTTGALSGGTSVAVTGANFVSGVTVNFGSNAATSVVVNSATSITAVAPAGVLGTVDVTVVNSGIVSALSSADHFSYVAVPTVTGINPTLGSIAGGTPVTVTGTNFGAGATVHFGGTLGTSVVVASSTSLTVLSPAESIGTQHVTVTTGGGTSAISSADQFSYVGAPTITGISPTIGVGSGGNSVTITGTNFVVGSTVQFGTNAAASVVINSSTSITAISPSGSLGTVDITVTTGSGTSATSTADQFTYENLPTVTGISPTGGPTASGTMVTITGTNFFAGTTVSFGATPATSITINSLTSITATAPSSTAGIVDITVTNAIGTSATSSSDKYTYTAAPTITSISPSSGKTLGSDVVTINGTNFTNTANVYFGGNISPLVTFGSSTVLTAVTPAVSAGTYHTTVGTVGGLSAAVTADEFTFLNVPTVTGLTSTNGPVGGGTVLTIAGTNFVPSSTVYFGSILASSVTYNSASSLTVTSPSASAGVVDITVQTAGGTSTTGAVDKFTYLAVPTVTSVSPSAGPIAGGTAISIVGTSFATGASVKFGTTSASTTVNSSTSITATTPALTAGTYHTTATTSGGTSSTSTGDQFTALGIPTVTGLAPNTGTIAGGTTVTITGTNFASGATVKFGTVSATSITVNTSTSMTAVAPAESAGVVDVQVTTLGGTSSTSSADQFTYQVSSLPSITSISPAGSMAGTTTGSIVITGINFTGATGVTFGGTSATYVVNSNTQITVTAPSLSQGVVNVVVSTSAGSSPITQASQFRYIAGSTVGGSVFGSWTPQTASGKSAVIYDTVNKKRTYNNIIESGGTSLVVADIVNNPTNYTVYDFYGNTVASGTMPNYSTITGPTDQITGSATLSSTPTNFTTLPTIKHIDYVTGTFTVPNMHTSNATYGAVGQGSWIVYFNTQFPQVNIEGNTFSVTLSGFTPTGYNGTYNGIFVSNNIMVIQNVANPGTITGMGSGTVSIGVSTQSSLTLTLSGGHPSVGDVLVITYATQTGAVQDGGLELPTSGQCGVTNWINAINYNGGLTTGVIVGSVDTTTSGNAVTIYLAGTSGEGVAATLSRWPNMSLGEVVDNAYNTYGGQITANSIILPSTDRDQSNIPIVNKGNGELVVGVAGSNGVFSSGVGMNNFSGLPSNNISPSGVSYVAGWYQQALAGQVNASNLNGWSYTGGYSQSGAYATLVPATGSRTLTIPAPTSPGYWEPGYYYINFTIPGIGATGSLWGDTVDEVAVLVARNSSNLPNVANLPAWNANPEFGDTAGTGEDLYMHGFNAIGPHRTSITSGNAPAAQLNLNYGTGTGGIVNVEQIMSAGNGTLGAKDISEPTAFYLDSTYNDSARPHAAFVDFPNNDIGYVKVGFQTGSFPSSGSFTFSYNNGTASTTPVPYNASHYVTQYTGSTFSITGSTVTLPVSTSTYFPSTNPTPTYGYIQDSSKYWHSFTWTGNSGGSLTGVTITGTGTINQYASVVYSPYVAALMTTSGFPSNGFQAAWGTLNYSWNTLFNSSVTGVLSLNTGSIVGTPLPSISSTFTLCVIPGISPSGTFYFTYVDASGTTHTSTNVAWNASETTVLSAITGMTGLSGVTIRQWASAFYGALGLSDIIEIILPLGLTNFTINTGGLTNVTAYCTLNDWAYKNQIPSVGSALTAYNSGIDYTWYEGQNEPDSNFHTAANAGLHASANQYANLRAALQSGNSNAKVMGPALANNGPNGNAYLQSNSSVIDWVRAVRSAGQDVDALSMHIYNGWSGQYQMIEGNLADLRTSLATFSSPSLANIPFWCTEAGNIRLSYTNTSTDGTGAFIDSRRIINWLTTLYLGGERYGLTKEHINIFYDYSHSASDFYSPLHENKDLFPHHAFYRTYSDEIYGKTWYSSNVTGPISSALSCGSVGNNIYRVDVFHGTSGTCVILTAQGIPNDTITLNVPDTGTIIYSDFQGNLSTVTASGGQITLPISDLPTYIRLAASSYTSVSVSDVGSGVKTATDLALTSTASVSAISGSLTTPYPASYAVDGHYRTDGYLAISGSPDYAFSTTSNAATINAAFQLHWGSNQTMNQVIIRQLAPWTDIGPASAITQATLQYSTNGTTWINCPTTAGNHWNTNGVYNNTTATSFQTALGQLSKYMTFYDYNWVHHVHFSTPVVANYLRLVVTGVTYGNLPDQTSNSLHDNLNAYLRISEFVVM